MNLSGNVTSGYTALNHALKELRLRWEQTKDQWNDAVRERFEKERWEPLEAQVIGALRAMDRLVPMLAKMQHDCSDR